MLEMGCGAPSIPPSRHRSKLPSLPIQVERRLALLHVEPPNLHPLQQALGLRLREVAELNRHKPRRSEQGSPRKHLLGGPVTPDHAILDPGLQNEPLYLARHILVSPRSIDGVEQNYAGLQRVEEVMGEEQVAPVTSLIHGDDDLGEKLLDQAEKRRKGRALPRSHREVHGNGLIASGGENENLRRVKGIDARYIDFERYVEISSEMGEVFPGEMELEGVEGVGGYKGGDFEHGNGRGSPMGELLHEGRPLPADANVEVNDVDAVGGAELLEESLGGSEVCELENWGDLGEGLVGAELQDDVQRSG